MVIWIVYLREKFLAVIAYFYNDLPEKSQKGKLYKKKTLEGACYLILSLLLVTKSPEVKVWQLKNISSIQLKFCIGLYIFLYVSF